MHWEKFVVYYFLPQGHFWYSILMAGKFIIFTDGGARGNPGPAGIGGALFNEAGVLIGEVSQYIGETTNNQAEYQALEATLRQGKEMGGKEVKCFFESQHGVGPMNQ